MAAMISLLRRAVPAALLAGAAGLLHAQAPQAASPAVAPALPASAAQPTQARQRTPVVGTAAQAQATAATLGEAVTTVTVIEDEGARIEETRLRGAAQRITVQSKVGQVPAYEIIVAPEGRDLSQDRGATGRRAWSLFSF